jgi:hypothetical protein
VTDAEIESAVAVHRQAIEALEAQSRRICDSERPQMAVACDGVIKGPDCAVRLAAHPAFFRPRPRNSVSPLPRPPPSTPSYS